MLLSVVITAIIMMLRTWSAILGALLMTCIVQSLIHMLVVAALMMMLSLMIIVAIIDSRLSAVIFLILASALFLLEVPLRPLIFELLKSVEPIASGRTRAIIREIKLLLGFLTSKRIS